jgi:Phospholipase_D-nuclease N-terminal
MELMNWILVAIGVFVLLVVAALWIGCIIDALTRPDLNGLKKAGWVLFILVLPILGSVVYLISRPKNLVEPEQEVDEIWGQEPDSFPTTWNDAAETITRPYQQRE